MRRAHLHGILAAALLGAAYLTVVGLLQGLSHAIEELLSLWYLMVPLLIGFGIQVALFSHLRTALRASASGLGASGGVSAGSMVACCAHHITDVAPLIGFSGAALFLTQYQAVFLLAGVLSNGLGILMLLSLMQKHSLAPAGGRAGTLFRYNLTAIRNAAIVASGMILFAAAFIIPIGTSGTLVGDTQWNLQKLTDDQNGVTVEVTPIRIGSTENSAFSITLTAHEGSLDTDLAAAATLTDNTGQTYRPVRWEGSPPGGHHRSGMLVFPPLPQDISSLRLVIEDSGSVGTREFGWGRK